MRSFTVHRHLQLPNLDIPTLAPATAILAALALLLGAGSPADNAYGQTTGDRTPDSRPKKKLEKSSRSKLDRVLRGQPSGLTEEETVRRVLDYAPQIAVKRAEKVVADVSPGTTLARYLPKITLLGSATKTNQVNFDLNAGGFAVGALNSGGLVVGPCPNGGGNCVLDAAGSPVAAVAAEPFQIPTINYSLQATGSLPLSDFLRLPWVISAADKDLESATHQLGGEIRNVATQARISYYEWVRMLAQQAVARDSVASVTARLEDAELGLKAGVVSETDVLQIRSAKAAAKNTVAAANSGEAIARDRLMASMGRSPGKLVLGNNTILRPQPPLKRSLKNYIAHGLAEREDLKGLRAAQEAVDKSASAARFDEFPKLAATGTINYANPNPQFFPPRPVWRTNWNIGVNVSWSLDGYLMGRSQRRELQARTAVADATLSSAQLMARSEVVAAWEELARTQATVRNGKIDVNSAEVAYDRRALEFKAGEVTATQLLDAETERFRARITQLNAFIDRRVAWIQLRHAAGFDNSKTDGYDAEEGAQ